MSETNQLRHYDIFCCYSDIFSFETKKNISGTKKKKVFIFDTAAWFAGISF